MTHSLSFWPQCVQLQELFDVRHSVFLLGPAGAGKSRVWTTLQKTFKNMGRKPVSYILDPKSVSNDELFGVINPATREWKDGVYTYIHSIMIRILSWSSFCLSSLHHILLLQSSGAV